MGKKKFVSKRILYRVGDERVWIASRTIRGEQVYVLTFDKKGAYRPHSMKFDTLAEALNFAKNHKQKLKERATYERSPAKKKLEERRAREAKRRAQGRQP